MSDTLTVVSPKPAASFPELVAQQADRSPEALALVTPLRRWTYREFQDRIARLAQQLSAYGVARGERVGLVVQRDCSEDAMDLIAALLAIMRIGAVYVPLSAALPRERFALIVQDAEIKTVLGFRMHAKAFTQTATWRQIRPVYLEDLAADLANFDPWAPAPPLPEDLAYILYTTGTSTGNPKGVMVDHQALAHYACTQNAALEIRSEDRATQGFALSFDASLSDLTMLAAGACLYPFSTEVCMGGRALFDWLADQAITIATGVPSLILTLPDRPLPASLRLLVVGGEVCPPALVERFWRPGLRIVNAYGLTETTVCCTLGDCFPGQPITIGKALAGITVSVRDAQLQPVPPGTAGQICVSGPGLARGYTDSLLTAQRFLRDPCDASTQLFVTQDEGVYTPSGALRFLGRLDASRQFKRHGQLIDLDEVEATLLRAPGLLEGAVEEVQGRVVAYVACGDVPYCSDDERRVWEVHTRRILSSFLGETLFAFMLPQAYVFVPRLPRTESDKLDRQALRAFSIPWSEDVPETGAIQAQGHVEKAIAEVVAQVLTRKQHQFALLRQLDLSSEEAPDLPAASFCWQQINMAHSAAELGLESLDAPDLVQLVFELFGVSIEIQDLYVPLQRVARAIADALASGSVAAHEKEKGPDCVSINPHRAANGSF